MQDNEFTRIALIILFCLLMFLLVIFMPKWWKNILITSNLKNINNYLKHLIKFSCQSTKIILKYDQIYVF